MGVYESIFAGRICMVLLVCMFILVGTRMTCMRSLSIKSRGDVWIAAQCRNDLMVAQKLSRTSCLDRFVHYLLFGSTWHAIPRVLDVQLKSYLSDATALLCLEYMSPQLADIPEDEFRRHFSRAVSIANPEEQRVYADDRVTMSAKVLKCWQQAAPFMFIDRYRDVPLHRGYADIRYTCDTFDVRRDGITYRIVWVYCENGQDGECGVSHTFHVLSRDFDTALASLTECLYS
jgi:hypothetical protein